MLRYALLGEGSSDTRLLPVLTWLLSQCTSQDLDPAWADLSVVYPRPITLSAKIAQAAALYPADILFIHRDADGADRELRAAEISAAAQQSGVGGAVCVIPIRMQEAWFLSDEDAIRRAANNPRGDSHLAIPPRHRWETIPDPKAVLGEALRRASGYSGRRLQRFDVNRAMHRVAELTADYGALRGLTGFDFLETNVRGALRERGSAP